MTMIEMAVASRLRGSLGSMLTAAEDVGRRCVQSSFLQLAASTCVVGDLPSKTGCSP